MPAMSLFRAETFACPECTTPIRFQVADSLNADRRPDLRDAILDDSYQRGVCDACGCAFRREPLLTYLDIGRGQWIQALPPSALPRWAEFEGDARLLFERGFGAAAPPVSRQIGAHVAPRLVFGWAGLREKLLCVEHAIDDAWLEVLKAALLRAGEASQVGDACELRLCAAADETLALGRIRDDADPPEETLHLPRSLYDQVHADPAWRPVREQVGAGPFVDINRLLVA
jgi:CpXC protein